MKNARDHMIAAALAYQAAQMNWDQNPEDPHGDAQMELQSEILDCAVVEYVKDNEDVGIRVWAEMTPAPDAVSEVVDEVVVSEVSILSGEVRQITDKPNTPEYGSCKTNVAEYGSCHCGWC